MTQHRQRRIVVGRTEDVIEVDEGMAELVTALWVNGYRTTASCECQADASNHAWVAFTSAYMAQRFASKVPGSTIISPTAAACAANPGDPSLGGTGVAFPSEAIGDAVRAVLA